MTIATIAPQTADLLTVREAAAYLRMSHHWVYKQVEAGLLPCVRLGRNLRFRVRDLAALIDSSAGR